MLKNRKSEGNKTKIPSKTGKVRVNIHKESLVFYYFKLKSE